MVAAMDATPTEWLETAADPFVLLDFEGSRKLYRRPHELIEVYSQEKVLPALDRLRGKEAVGFLTYESGFALETALSEPRSQHDLPLMWFLVGTDAEDAPPLPDPNGAWAGSPSPLMAREDYLSALAEIRDRILHGDVYQTNFTFQSEVTALGHPLALYAQLRERAQADWSAVVYTGAHWILCFSPELFFTCEEGRVTCRPMKGTAAAGTAPENLRSDPKQRAENLMIVDLIRNDLSRVAKPGSVKVPELFAVESYPTVMQMTSTVTAELEDGLGPVDLLKAAFPCGSITGAPKIRAMEIIVDVEPAPRGIYTGAIGRLSSDGAAAFNVAIRTLVLADGEAKARLGLGSGIVADSRPEDEWEECLRKGAFIGTPSAFSLIETMRIDEDGALPDLEAHLDRIQRSAQTFAYPFDRERLTSELVEQARAYGLGRLRLQLSHDGRWRVEMSPRPATPQVAEVAIAGLPVDRSDFRLAHKTSDRAFYDGARIASETFEVLFTDANGFLTEGSFTNLFVPRGGRLITPPRRRGLLPGILRERLLAGGEAVEADLRLEELHGKFYIGNALRGLIPARLRL